VGASDFGATDGDDFMPPRELGLARNQHGAGDERRPTGGQLLRQDLHAESVERDAHRDTVLHSVLLQADGQGARETARQRHLAIGVALVIGDDRHRQAVAHTPHEPFVTVVGLPIKTTEVRPVGDEARTGRRHATRGDAPAIHAFDRELLDRRDATDGLCLGLVEREEPFEGKVDEFMIPAVAPSEVTGGTVSAGIGLDRTRVVIVADPTITTHIVELEAKGAFGRFTFMEDVTVSEENRKTGKLVAMAMVKSVRQLASTLVVAA